MINLYLTKESGIYDRVKTVYSINNAGKIGHILAKNETRPSPYTIEKNKIKMD